MAKAILKYLLSLTVFLLLGTGQLSANSVHVGAYPGSEDSIEEAIENAVESNQEQHAIFRNIVQLDFTALLEVPFFEEEEEKLNSSFKSPKQAIIYLILSDAKVVGLEKSIAHTTHDTYRLGILSDRFLLFEVFRI